jgi:hypothetical protein
VPDLLGGRDVVVGGGARGPVEIVERDLGRPPRGGPEALAAFVVRDLDQPVVRLDRTVAAAEGAVGAEEGGLRDVLGVGLVVEDRERVAVHVVDVALVEPLEGSIRVWTLDEEGGHAR